MGVWRSLAKHSVVMEWASTVPVIAVLAGGLVGWITSRGQEKRDMRRAAYVRWLTAAGMLPTWPPDEPMPEGHIQLPHPTYQARLNECSNEIALLGSKRVVEAVDAYAARLHHTNLNADSLHLALMKAEVALARVRSTVIDAMRRDLRTRKLKHDLTGVQCRRTRGVAFGQRVRWLPRSPLVAGCPGDAR
jgi:hypothetical protein